MSDPRVDVEIRSDEEVRLILAACLAYLDFRGLQMPALRVADCLDLLANEAPLGLIDPATEG